MQFSLIKVWLVRPSFGLDIMSYEDLEEILSEDGEYITRSLLGFSYDVKERFLQIDFLWRFFEFKFKKEIQ